MEVLIKPLWYAPSRCGEEAEREKKEYAAEQNTQLKFFLPTIQPPISSSLVFQFYQWGADREGKLPEKLTPLTVWATVTALCPSAPSPPLDGFGV